MNKNWPYILLALLVAAWVGQMFLQQEIEKEPASAEVKASKPVKTSSVNNDKEQAETKVTKDKPKPPPKTTPPPESTPEIEMLIERVEDDQALVIQELINKRGTSYKKLSGYSAVNDLLEQECGNLIDTDIERLIIDVNTLSGNDIFVSEHFCMKSAIWNRVRNIDAPLKRRTSAQLNALQDDYDNLINELQENTERIVVTKLFVNQMSKYYDVFPTYEAFGNNRYIVAALVDSGLKRGRTTYLRAQRFKLLNQLDIPQYLFKDILETILPEQEQEQEQEQEREIISLYKEKVDSVFAEHIKLLEKESNAD